jgi:hypothetical protein
MSSRRAAFQVQYEWLMETVLDEDRLPGYKLFCSRFEVR